MQISLSHSLSLSLCVKLHTPTHALHHLFHRCSSALHILMSSLQEAKLSAVIEKKINVHEIWKGKTQEAYDWLPE